MKQKIVIKLCMDSGKARSKAMKIAADAHGVISVEAKTEEDHLVVTGVGVDATCLTRALRRKVSHATIVSVAEVKPEKKEKYHETKPLCWEQKPICCVQYHACSVAYEEDPPLCTIM